MRFLNILCKDICKGLDLHNYFKMTQLISLWIQTDIHPFISFISMTACKLCLVLQMEPFPQSPAFEYSSILIQVPPKWLWARTCCFHNLATYCFKDNSCSEYIWNKYFSKIGTIISILQMNTGASTQSNLLKVTQHRQGV